MEATPSYQEIALVAGGCFWCMQPPFDGLKGVISTRVGYTGGAIPNPTYEAVCTGKTGHFEAIEVVFNPKMVTYAQILERFWHQIDPTDSNGQFADQGSQYHTAIFYLNETQRKLAEASKTALEKSKKFKAPIATQILPAKPFYPAEPEHQAFYQHHPLRYQSYKVGSGREVFLQKVWKSPN